MPLLAEFAITLSIWLKFQSPMAGFKQQTKAKKSHYEIE